MIDQGVSACFGNDSLDHIASNFQTAGLLHLPPVLAPPPSTPLLKLYAVSQSGQHQNVPIRIKNLTNNSHLKTTNSYPTRSLVIFNNPGMIMQHGTKNDTAIFKSDAQGRWYAASNATVGTKVSVSLVRRSNFTAMWSHPLPLPAFKYTLSGRSR